MRNWTDFYGNDIPVGSFISYGCGRGRIAYGVVVDYDAKGKMKVQIPELDRIYVPGPGQHGAGGHFEVTGWKNKKITLTDATVILTPLEIVKKLPAWPEVDYQDEYRNEILKLIQTTKNERQTRK